jgi:hypothetical protein
MHSDEERDRTSQPPIEEARFEDGLTLEDLVADAIWEQIELNRRKNASSSRDPNSPRPQIDPGFQRDYNNL